jgi:AcrR family transcriptional regulator
MADVKSRRERYADITRTAVLDTARMLFVRQGFAATSVDEIARTAEVSKGAVYHHFSDKKELFAELFTQIQQDVMRAVEDSSEGSATGWERAAAATHVFLASYVADEPARVILQQAPTVLGQDRTRQIDERIALPFVRRLLEELQASGQLRTDSITAAARMVFSVLCEATSLFADAADPAGAAEDAEALTLLMFSGLLDTSQVPAEA